MFKSMYKTCEHPDRKIGEAVLNVKGVIVALIIYLLSNSVLLYGMSYLIGWVNGSFGTNFGNVELNVAYQLITIALMILFLGRFYWENLKAFFKEFKAVYIWAPIVCYIMIFVGNIAATMLLSLIRGEMQTSTSNNDTVNALMLQNPIPMIFVAVILAPILEETIFRGALSRSMTSSKNYFVKALGFVIPVFLFALLHVWQYAFLGTDANGAVYLTFNADEFLSIISYIPMGIGFTLCSYLCKNFWGSVACHILNNGIAMAMMILMSMLKLA
ncbi:MAG: type II CAAX endopeptidase family protein [Firmicutes bacterium]|nr:type II CAAX endopeptidase family protein [Bacillota bacterium]